MQKLTVLLNDVATAAAVLEASQLIAARIPCVCRLVHFRPAIDPSFMPTEEIMTETRLREFRALQDKRSRALKRIVDDWAGDMTVVPALEEVLGELVNNLEIVLHTADIIAVGTACGTDRLEATETIAWLLKQHQIPILVVPPAIPTSVGARPGIAWKSGLQIDAAVASVRQLIQNTDRIQVLRGAPCNGADAAADAATSTLWAEGVRVSTSVFNARGRHAGRALLTAAHQAGCDLLIMGTHPHGWLRHALFEGLPEKVIAETEIPILLHA